MNRQHWYLDPAAVPCPQSQKQASRHQQQLTKPPGSLGRLEQVAITLAGLQRTAQPVVDTVAISIFAADHGVAAENVSAFPQVVTGEMVKNFAGGGAAIAVLARRLRARLRVANLGTVAALPPIDGVDDCRIGPGTANFTRAPAMNPDHLQRALAVGKQHLEAALAEGCDLFIGGEMGIANTTSATALACGLLGQPPADLVGPGTGIDAATLAHKRHVIETGLAQHGLEAATDPDPLRCLACVGGFEIAALTGAYLRAGQCGVPVLVDGFIATVAALVAVRLQPAVAPWLMLSHQSAEPGHRRVVDVLTSQYPVSAPLVDLGMRLGEASGAAVAVPLLQLACTLHAEMATFSSAQVTNRD